ncbi:MAG: SDR family NAD(P)-dependent oxidoreductase [Phycisphaeraceae bacterium]|nr:SDR family NAD(P)-dependent oxidoreductase [Phycisphaeraceae bacterium]
MPNDLRGKVIVITGASSGIGAATAEACAAAGMTVVLAARRADRLEEVARRCRQAGAASGGQALVIPTDVRSDAQVEHLIDLTLEKTNRLDAVFANAGYGLCASVVRTSPQQLHEIFDTNFFGTVRLLRAAVPHLIARGGGHLLICASVVSKVGLPMYGAYSATKAAQDSLGSALRAELDAYPITVSTIYPIGTVTEFTKVVGEISHLPHARPNTPSRLAHSPEKVARAIVRCLRRPRPEVWPNRPVRFALAIAIAFPRLTAWAMRLIMRHRYQKTSTVV